MLGTEDKLSRYGNAFQLKTIALLLHDALFFERVIENLREKYYDSDASKWIIKNVVEYYTKYKKIPTLEFFKFNLAKEDNIELKTSVIEILKKTNKVISDTDLEFVRDEFVEFIKTQAIKNAVMNSIDYLSVGSYDKIRKEFDNALNAAESKDIGYAYKTELQNRVNKLNRNTISTGWQVIDELMDGGLGPGELGVIIGSSGVGKSWFLSAIGANAMKRGQNVLHITLELSSDSTGARYDSILSGIPSQDIKYNYDKISAILDDIPGELQIVSFPAKNATVYTLSSIFDRVTRLLWKPDIVLLDYADLLRPVTLNNKESIYVEAGNIYIECRALATEKQVPMWTPSQSQRSGVRSEIIETDQIADSFQKVMHADFIMSVSRTRVDKLNHTGRVHVAKNRFGEDGVTFPMKADPGHGTFEVYHYDSDEGRELYALMKDTEKEAEKKSLSDAYTKFKEKKERLDTPVTSNELFGSLMKPTQSTNKISL